ncbi:hypothetical protein [Prochlorococcus sp. MIT 1306]|uniref:hypothetical protein n=1 Tax=Prochlorococcus sp. MIT 1306 TaxID=1799667 RepID=UPI0007BB43AB|nr:hypothetical protein [Prochlorococcus sp. MIT 1306]KZR65030.1 hypothetical protein PMIT1306_00711 [Prochlorococcus sp. MIT 1306]
MSEDSFWSDETEFFGSRNPERARYIGRFIKEYCPRNLLDIGCGNQYIKTQLNCEITNYIPLDIVSRSDDCIVLDINKDQIPDGEYTMISTIGLMQYIKSPGDLIRQISNKCKYWVTTLSPYGEILSRFSLTETKFSPRLKNLLTISQFLALIYPYFDIEEESICPTGCILYILSPKGASNKRRCEKIRRVLKIDHSSLICRSKREWTRAHYQLHIGQLRETIEIIPKTNIYTHECLDSVLELVKNKKSIYILDSKKNSEVSKGGVYISIDLAPKYNEFKRDLMIISQLRWIIICFRCILEKSNEELSGSQGMIDLNLSLNYSRIKTMINRSHRVIYEGVTSGYSHIIIAERK